MLESVWERLRAFGCKQTEHILYWISIWCVLGVGLVYIAAFYIAHVTGNDRLLQCKMKLYFGIPCPGCGGTRAIWSLLHGRVLQAVYYNAFAVYGAVWYLLFFISQTVQRVAARFDDYTLAGVSRFFNTTFNVLDQVIAIVVLIVQYLLKLFVPGYRI